MLPNELALVLLMGSVAAVWALAHVYVRPLVSGRWTTLRAGRNASTSFRSPLLPTQTQALPAARVCTTSIKYHQHQYQHQRQLWHQHRHQHQHRALHHPSATSILQPPDVPTGPPSSCRTAPRTCFGATTAARVLTPSLVRRSAATTADSAAGPAAASPVSHLGQGEDGLPPRYDFSTVEGPLYQWWEESGFFKPSDSDAPAYTVPMPPPNVTGRLHMGHAMFVTLEDILVRFHRMRGRPTLWLPGTDHAGIATQMLVERELNAEGTDRRTIGRAAFLERAWQYKEDKGGAIVQQMRGLGASADWSRQRFTMDDGLSAAVVEAFVRLHEQGLVYRGTRMVNWSPALQTAVSDLEVVFSEEQGTLYTFKYPVVSADGQAGANDGADPDEYLPVATTRPETILGDTAVCVHPEDARFKHLVGRECLVPMTGRRIPIIADTYVDMEFGTGALKITPAHDTNDWEIGQRHDLPQINIMNKDGSLNAAAGPDWDGMPRDEARVRVWERLGEMELVIKSEPHNQRVPRAERTGEVIEPMISTQWFVNTQTMAKQALDAVQQGEVKIIPERFNRMWEYWLEEPRDWCVSRQLWWGHRIPVWYAEGIPEEEGGGDGLKFVVARDEEEARRKATEAGIPADARLVQDDDVLDTWFSSSLWPFATLNWPNDAGVEGSDFEKFYPTAVLETGYDILFFWVARMMMMGLNLTGRPPFKVIYLHGLVRDGEGQKMSKTKGNVIDPLEVMGEYGTDALRYSLVTGATPGQDVPLSMEKIESNRNFANKLWNAGRFLLRNLDGISAEERSSLAVTGPMRADELDSLPMAEAWVVTKCHELVQAVTEGLDDYRISEVGRLVHDFLWDEYADWYIESAKTRTADPEAAAITRRVLVYVFDTCLRLLHPFMPFVTEALWQQLPRNGAALMTAPWPLPEGEQQLPTAPVMTRRYELLQSLVRAIRNARAEYKVPPGKKIAARVCVADPELLESLQDEAAIVALLGRVDPQGLTYERLEQGDEAAEQERAVHLVLSDGVEAYLPMAGLVDSEVEMKRLTKQAEKMEKELTSMTNRMSQPNFVSKASPDVVEKTRQQIATKTEQLAVIRRSIEELSQS